MAYKNTHKVDFRYFSTSELEDDFWGKGNFLSNLIKELRPKKYKRIIIKDSHYLIPYLVTILERQCFAEKDVEWFIHLFGDFSLRAKEWFYCGEILKNKRVRFICASPRQVNLVRSFAKSPKKIELSKVIFPIDGKQHKFSSSIRTSERLKMQASPSEMIFIYTGRLSQQKNIEKLIQLFTSKILKVYSNSRLLLVGSYDDIGSQMLGQKSPLGSTYNLIQSHYKKLTRDEQKRVVFLGDKNTKELHRLYCAADCFISLSLYHDEDYGMSVAEAMAHGLPLILTDWGGYTEFASLSHKSILLPVSIDKRGFAIKTQGFEKKLDQLVQYSKQSTERSIIAKSLSKKLNIECATESLNRELASHCKEKFAGFSKKMLLLDQARLNGLLPSTENDYAKFYSPYFEAAK